MNKIFAGWIYIHISVLLFGVAGLFGKWVTLPAVMLVLGRTFFATLFLGSFLLIRKTSFLTVLKDRFWLMFLPGVILIFHWFTFFKAIQISTVAIGLFGYATFPVFVYLMEIVFLRYPFSYKRALFIILSFAGILLMFPDAMHQINYLKGLLLATLSGFSFAILALINKHLVKDKPALLISFYQDMIAAMILMIFLFDKIPALSGYQVFQLALLGFFCTALAHTLYIHGMKYISASTASVVALLEPVYGVILAVILFHEVPSWTFIMGGAFILMGGYGMFRSEKS